jgi:hypothetical protein
MVIHLFKSGRGRAGFQIIQGLWLTALTILEAVEAPIITDNGLDLHPLHVGQGEGVFKVEVGTGKKIQRPQKSSTVSDSQPRQGDDGKKQRSNLLPALTIKRTG